MDGILLFKYVSLRHISWWGFLTASRLNIALELAKHNAVYEDIASKFFEVCSIVRESSMPLTNLSTSSLLLML